MDAQTCTKTINKKHFYPIKHLIEIWAGRYVSRDDVQVAANIHPRITGNYPYFNISSQLILPSSQRLDDIGEANKHPDYREKLPDDIEKRYKRTE